MKALGCHSDGPLHAAVVDWERGFHFCPEQRHLASAAAIADYLEEFFAGRLRPRLRSHVAPEDAARGHVSSAEWEAAVADPATDVAVLVYRPGEPDSLGAGFR